MGGGGGRHCTLVLVEVRQVSANFHPLLLSSQSLQLLFTHSVSLPRPLQHCAASKRLLAAFDCVHVHAVLWQEKTEQDEARIEALTQQVEDLQNHVARLQSGGAVPMAAALDDHSPAAPQATPMLDSQVIKVQCSGLLTTRPYSRRAQLLVPSCT